ncbi:hypothetical protein KHA96_18700 [Bacillus sp. FJAT-49711]|nr:hypothetical protein [Bacillus sp. FJAT-49711]MBS4220333.1 hypothetical protein [Bacillus sp. FJAT-49711]
MQLWTFLGLMAILGVVGYFIMYFVSSSMDSNDANQIDEVPQNNFNQN